MEWLFLDYRNTFSSYYKWYGGCWNCTASIFYGGATNAPSSSVVSTTAVYDGSSWTTGGALPAATRNWGGKSGTSTAALAASGVPGPGSPNPFTNTTMTYDGTSWTITPATTVVSFGGAGANQAGASSTSAFIAAAGGPSHATKTEEYDFGINTITSAAWASGGNLNTARYNLAAAGSQTASAVFGGSAPSLSNATEIYNGSTWTTSPGTLNTSRSNLAGFGTSTAAIAAGGSTPPVSNSSES